MPPIEIVYYRPGWVAEFAAIGALLRSSLGDVALRINHIGSTSVPGLAAKDVIDIQVSVESLDLGDEVGGSLERIGLALDPDRRWDHLPPGSEGGAHGWDKRMASELPGERRTHVHFRVSGTPNERYALLFRDYLRSNTAAAKSYATIKRELAARFAEDLDGYYAVKDPVCDLVIDAAELWASATRWTIPVSDA